MRIDLKSLEKVLDVGENHMELGLCRKFYCIDPKAQVNKQIERVGGKKAVAGMLIST